MAESKPLREWMQSVTWPANAPDWSPLGKIDCISLEEALSMIACSSRLPIDTTDYYKAALWGLDLSIKNCLKGVNNFSEIEKIGYAAGWNIREQRQNLMIVPEVPQSVAFVSVAPDDYERMSKRDAAWSEMVEKLQTLSGAVADLVLQMEKL